VDAGQLAVEAARIRLAVDLDAEAELADLLDAGDDGLLAAVRGLLKERDVVLPSLSRRLGSTVTIESYGLTVPTAAEQLPAFSGEIARTTGDVTAPGPAVAQRLRELADRRWGIATSTMFLAEACRRADEELEPDPLVVAVCVTLAAFRGDRMTYTSRSGQPLDLDELVRRAASSGPTIAPDGHPILRREAERDPTATEQVEPWLAAYVLGPQPLDELLDLELGVS
jgi:hypothetical protein